MLKGLPHFIKFASVFLLFAFLIGCSFFGQNSSANNTSLNNSTSNESSSNDSSNDVSDEELSSDDSDSKDEKKPPKIIFVLDASGSMWGKVNGEAKIVSAKTVLKKAINDLPDDSEVGLIAYGHRKKGDCEDIETLSPLKAIDKTGLGEKIDALDAEERAFLLEEMQAVVDGPVMLMSGASGEGTVDVLRALRTEIDDNRLRHKKAAEAEEEVPEWRP